MRRQTSFLILLISIVLVSGLLLIGGCSSTSSVETQSTATPGTTGTFGTGSASDTPPAIPSSLQRAQGPAAPSQPQGIPGIVVTSNGGSPAFTTDDVRNYIQAHPLAGDQQETITRIEFLSTSKVQQLLDGETIGTPPNYMLCYGQLQGAFTFTSWDGTSLTFNTGVMVFDAHTGNLLLEGGLPTSGGGSPTPPVATPTVPKGKPTPTVHRGNPTPTPAPKGGPTATTPPAPTPTTPPAPAPTATPYPALQVQISSPAEGSTYYTNQTIPCSGTYSGGAGQTIPNSDITWTAYNTVSGTYTAMGTGTSINASLAAGSYEIQFEVFDPVAQESAEASVGISVVQFIP